MPRKRVRGIPKSIYDSGELRKNMTKEEKHLWYDFLADVKPKFQRQRAIGQYIADFYCDKAKLVIELDGSQHYEDDAEEYDKRRTLYFESQGIRVIRFSNRNVNCEFAGVCATILHELGQEAW